MESLTPEQVAEFREAFDFLDRNGDGHIHAKELGETLRNLGASPSDNELQVNLLFWSELRFGFVWASFELRLSFD